MSDLLKKALERAGTVRSDGTCCDAAFAADYPIIAEFLTVSRVDGKNRITATLNVSYGQGLFRAFLNDRETRQSVCVSSGTFWGMLEALETTLASDDPGWRSQNDDGSTSRKKKT